jgi:DNA-directed RNA polymerase subunit H (RpoH/RPB5)
MDPEIKDLVVRSRPIVLELLEARGYDTTPYQDQAPSAIANLVQASWMQLGASPLKIRVPKKENSGATNEFCEVVYLIFDKVKTNINKKPLDGPNRWNYIETPETTDYIFILNESYHECFDAVAQQAWLKKIRLSFFHIKQMIMNPSKHSLVPLHEKVPADQIPEMKKELNLLSLTKLPYIKYHIDMQARWLGLVPGDVVKITRPSPSSGESVGYRVCVS